MNENKHGKCTNIDCEVYGQSVELQSWEDMVCQECELELLEIAPPPSPPAVKRFVVIGIAFIVLSATGFGVYNLLQRTSGPTPPPGPDSTRVEDPFASISTLLLNIASSNYGDDQKDRFVEEVLALCVHPEIEVRVVGSNGRTIEKLTMQRYINRIRLLGEPPFEIKTIYPAANNPSRISTIEMQQTNFR